MKMKKKNLMTALSIVFIISLIMSLTSAAKIISVHGQIQTDGVDVSITADADEGEVMPNKTVRYEPIIHYKGVDSWIRLKLDISNENIKLEHFNGLSDDWVRRGEYFYYTKPVHHGEYIRTFESFKIPKEWDELEPPETMASKFNIVANCDAVQERNFKPDFKAEKPWGDLEIEDSAYDGNEYEKYDGDIKAIDLDFKGAGKYALSTDNVIYNVLPGDTYKNEINLYNKGENDTEVFFYVSEADKKENNLLDVTELKMMIDGKVFYEGNLRAAQLMDMRTLCYMKPNEKHTLSYEIYVPSELKNKYQDKLDYFVWNFTTVEHSESPQTGDANNFKFFIIIAAVSLLLLLILKDRKDRKEEDEEENIED